MLAAVPKRSRALLYLISFNTLNILNILNALINLKSTTPLR